MKTNKTPMTPKQLYRHYTLCLREHERILKLDDLTAAERAEHEELRDACKAALAER